MTRRRRRRRLCPEIFRVPGDVLPNAQTVIRRRKIRTPTGPFARFKAGTFCAKRRLRSYAGCNIYERKRESVCVWERERERKGRGRENRTLSFSQNFRVLSLTSSDYLSRLLPKLFFFPSFLVVAWNLNFQYFDLDGICWKLQGKKKSAIH